MHWYLVYTKPRQEHLALHNLEKQGYVCYLPTLNAEKFQQGKLNVVTEPLFPRYLFVSLGSKDSAPGWGAIRSTKGVSRLICFGDQPAKIDGRLVDLLKAQAAVVRGEPQRLFAPGERVFLTEAPFAGVEGIYQMRDGERRVMVLIELLSKPVVVRVAPTGMRKTS